MAALFSRSFLRGLEVPWRYSTKRAAPLRAIGDPGNVETRTIPAQVHTNAFSMSGTQLQSLGELLTAQDACEVFVGAKNVQNIKISSRTDAGVHAYHNVSCMLNNECPPTYRYRNKLCTWSPYSQTLHVDLLRRKRQIGAILPMPEASSVRSALNGILRTHKEQVSIACSLHFFFRCTLSA